MAEPRCRLTAVVLLASAATTAGCRGTERSTDRLTGVAARATVTCDSAIEVDPAPAPSSAERVVLGRVALAQENGVPDPVATDGEAPRLRAKSGLLVRRGPTPVDLLVPPEWRGRLAITWGDAPAASELRVPGCPSSALPWQAYAGGFEIAKPVCAPLTVRVDGRERRLRFGIGARC